MQQLDAAREAHDGTAQRRTLVVAAKAREYGLDVDNHAERLKAAEEVLAEMAQTAPELGYVRRAIAAIRSWLRANVAALRGMELSDAEILRDYLLPARGWVQRGAAAGAMQQAAPAFSRAQGYDKGVDDAIEERVPEQRFIALAPSVPVLARLGMPDLSLGTTAGAAAAARGRLAQTILSTPTAIPGDDCGSARMRVDAWLSERVAP